MTPIAARPALRSFRVPFTRTPVRGASTTSEVASAASSTAVKAKENAAGATSKASEGLSKVTSSASSIISKAGPALSNSLGRIEGRGGRVLATIRSLYPPTVYYARVGAELSKTVFHGQRMAPPSLAQFRSYFQPVIDAIRYPSTILSQNPGLAQPQRYLNALRNISRQQVLTTGVIFAEVLGFFTIGEMVGRLKIVGYRSNGPAAEDH